jgi:hypothetical protein
VTEELRDHPYVRVWLEAGHEEGLAEGEARGEARGEAKALLVVLGGLGVDVPDAARERIMACTDHEVLESWLRRAVTAKTIDDVFED